MSFTADARRVRENSRSFAEREAALLRCVVRFAPFGVMGTFAHLDRCAGAGDRSTRLIAAVDVLETAHTAWRVELARFAQQRSAAKARGRRRVVACEVERYTSYGWPGGSAPGPSSERALDEGFLGKFGMTLWKPAPVDVRRRLRRAERAVRPPSRFDGCLLTVMIVVQGVIGLLAWLIADPPEIFWFAFAVTAMAATALAVVAGFRQAARHRSGVEALVRRHEASSQQLRQAEQTMRRVPTT